MSDREVPQPEQPDAVNDVDGVVDSANAGLDAAAAAARGDDSQEAPESAPESTVDADLAAFEAAERDFPGTFGEPVTDAAGRTTDAVADTRDDVTAVISEPTAHVAEESLMADAAYASVGDDTETRVVPSEPVYSEPVYSEPVYTEPVPSEPAAILQQPIFVQAPEAPLERGNRGTAGLIGLLATVSFAILYLGAVLGLGAIKGDVTGQNIGEAALAPLTTWAFWVPVAVFFLGFWLLGAFINRGRWGLWVVFGIIVGIIAYGGHILGQLFEAPFWLLTASEGAELVGAQLLAPLAIAAFVFARELTIWFGAWVARSGARKTELNAEAQREYERTLEAGPSLSR